MPLMALMAMTAPTTRDDPLRSDLAGDELLDAVGYLLHGDG